MTTANPTQPPTIAAFLFDTNDSVDALTHALDEQGVLGRLGAALEHVPQAGREAAASEIATVAHGLFDHDLGELFVAGWRKHADLTAAVDRTIANPGSSEVVELATHRITSVYQPFVELLVNQIRVATIHFELRTEILVRALVGTVRNGHLISLRSGTCDVTAALAAEGLQLASRQAHFDLPMLLHLPLRLQPRGDLRPSGATPSRILSRPWRARRPVNHPMRRRHHRPQLGQDLTAD